MSHENSISTLQARTLLAFVKKSTFALVDENSIKVESENILTRAFALDVYGVFNASEKPLYYAFVQSNLLKKAFVEGGINVLDYVAMFASEKQHQKFFARDFGAFGDLFEVLIRLALVGKTALIKAGHLTVKAAFCVDIVSRKYGKIEVCQNSKTWTFGTIENPVYGDFDSIIYGVFDENTQNEVFNACIHRDLKKAISIVTAYSVYWRDKNVFYENMENLTRGKFFTIKSGKIMNQYNPGKHTAFINAIENGVFKSLDEIL